MPKKQIIICVDDEFMVLDCLRIWIEEWFGDSHTVEVAESGEEALEVIRDHSDAGNEVCLVVSDYIMPNMKGDELLTRVHELLPRAVSIMLTGQVQPEVVEFVTRSSNLYCCLGKPWDSTELHNKIAGALELHAKGLTAL
jgi:DNA-binding NtrC family response regulator